jgi:hypothetical protein
MKKMLFLAFLAFTLNAKAQTHYSLVDTNKVWSVVECSCCCYTTFYKFKGDTTFGVYHYKKLYATGDSTLMNGWVYQNAMREDTIGKVYFYYESNDVLYYDFTLNKNDTATILGNDKVVIDSIDTVTLLDNEKRKQLFISSIWGNLCEDQWIEGIGSLDGLTDVGFCDIDDGSFLLCFIENDTLKFHENGYSSTCYYTAVGIKEIKNSGNLISISPNPASSEIQVISNQSSVVGIDVYNMLGEKVYTSPITDNRSPITVNIASLPSGMYFAEIKTEKGATVRKFVKQ